MRCLCEGEWERERERKNRERGGERERERKRGREKERDRHTHREKKDHDFIDKQKRSERESARSERVENRECLLSVSSVCLAMSEGSSPEGAVTRPGVSIRSRNGTTGFEMLRMMILDALTPFSVPCSSLIILPISSLTSAAPDCAAKV